MAIWYYYNENGEKIEVTGGQLKGLAKAGQITPDTIVETAEGKTAPARRVKGLKFAGTEQSKPTSETTSSEPEPLPSVPALVRPAELIAFDGEQLDQYRRTRAMVWLNIDGSEVWLNELLVLEGYARARLDFRYSHEAKLVFALAEWEARKDRRNLWKD